jgi:hypothetical protein
MAFNSVHPRKKLTDSNTFKMSCKKVQHSAAGNCGRPNLLCQCCIEKRNNSLLAAVILILHPYNNYKAEIFSLHISLEPKQRKRHICVFCHTISFKCNSSIVLWFTAGFIILLWRPVRLVKKTLDKNVSSLFSYKIVFKDV